MSRDTKQKRYAKARKAWRIKNDLPTNMAGRSIGVPPSCVSRPSGLDLYRRGYREVKGWNVRVKPEFSKAETVAEVGDCRIRAWNYFGWTAAIHTPEGKHTAGGKYLSREEAIAGALELAARLAAGRYREPIWA